MATAQISASTDITLITKEDTWIPVSSNILRNSSRVFDALLGTGFKEGNSFQEHIASGDPSPFEVRLPDDDPEAMKLLAAAIHRRNNFIPGNIDAENLLNFAYLVDKYHCSAAIQQTSGQILRNLSDILVQEHYDEPLLSAFLLDHAEGFKGLTERIAEQFTAAELEDFEEQRQTDYLKGLYKDLSWEVFETGNQLVEDIQEAASAMSGFYWNMCTCTDDPDTPREERDGSCEKAHLAVMRCHRELVWKRVWQEPDIIQKGGPGPLQTLIENIESLSCPPQDAIDATDGSLRPDCQARNVYRKFETEVQILKEAAGKVSVSCCLDCFRALRVRRGECRIAHQETSNGAYLRTRQ